MRRFLTMLRCLRMRIDGATLASPRFIGAGVDVRQDVRNSQLGRITAGVDLQLEAGVVLHAYGGTITLGRNVFIGPYTVIYGHGGVEIGDDCLVSMHCRILSSDHTVPAPGQRIRSTPDIVKPTRIGHDVWLGAGVTVLGGVTIGAGCVVGAGAVVKSDLPPQSIAVGIPARVIGTR